MNIKVTGTRTLTTSERNGLLQNLQTQRKQGLEGDATKAQTQSISALQDRQI